jgi:hypothetical protein
MDQHDPDYWTTLAMRDYGGTFVGHLGAAAMEAGERDRERIKTNWPDLWGIYQKIGANLQTDWQN